MPKPNPGDTRLSVGATTCMHRPDLASSSCNALARTLETHCYGSVSELGRLGYEPWRQFDGVFVKKAPLSRSGREGTQTIVLPSNGPARDKRGWSQPRYPGRSARR